MKVSTGYVVAAVLLAVMVLFVEPNSAESVSVNVVNALKVIMSVGCLLCFGMAARSQQKEEQEVIQEQERAERQSARGAHNYSPEFKELYDRINMLLILKKVDAVIELLQKENEQLPKE